MTSATAGAPSLVGPPSEFAMVCWDFPGEPEVTMYTGDGFWLLFLRVCLRGGSYTLVTSRPL